MSAVREFFEYRKDVSETALRFFRFHEANPEVLDLVVTELELVKSSGWKVASLPSLIHYARWVLIKRRRGSDRFGLNQNFAAYYGRLVAVLHPGLNGYFEMRTSERTDGDFGTELEPHGEGRFRRLRWADGTAIEEGWRPSTPHEPKPVRRRKRVHAD